MRWQPRKRAGTSAGSARNTRTAAAIVGAIFGRPPKPTSPALKPNLPNPKSKIINHQSLFPLAKQTPAQVTLLRQLLATDPTATPEQLSNRFDRKNPKHTEQIEGIIETLKELGQV
jgi:hypothetical protein